MPLIKKKILQMKTIRKKTKRQNRMSRMLPEERAVPGQIKKNEKMLRTKW